MTSELTLKTEGDIATTSADEMAELSQMARETNKGMSQGSNLAVMKINYDETANVVERGEWVVGQKKDKETKEITEEGKKVIGFIPLAVRDRYSMFVNKKKELNCTSMLFDRNTSDMDAVVGNTHGYPCGPGCPYRAIGADPRCGAQKVAMGIAICEDGTKVECVAYIKGSSYMPFVDYLAAATVHRSGAGSMDVPAYSFVCMLGSVRKKNDGTVYFVGTFEKGSFVGMDNIKKFYSMVTSQVEPMIEAMNQAWAKGDEEKDDTPSTGVGAKPATSAPKPEPAAAAATSGSHFPTESSDMDEIPWEEGKTSAKAKPEPVVEAEANVDAEDWNNLIDSALEI